MRPRSIRSQRFAAALSAVLATSILAGVAVVPALAGKGGRSRTASSSADRRVGKDFQGSWSIPEGKSIEIKGVNGSIEARATSGDQVEVIAVKSARRSDPDEVRIEAIEHEGGVTVCAVYPGRRGQPNECAPGKSGRMSVHDNDVQVEFKVRVPKGVTFVGRTVNGGIDVDDLEGPVEAVTVNGSVQLSTSDVAQAETVNGSINASMGIARWRDELEFRTVNGAITVVFPEPLAAQIHAETVNGGIDSDFPLTVAGRLSKRRISGTVGSGGGDLQLSTVNGSIHLRSAD